MERRDDDLRRIENALGAAGEILLRFAVRGFKVRRKAGGSLVTDADLEIDRLLHSILPRAGEGWLSEEQDPSDERFGARRVWIVDPLDGTEQFVAGIPEWCVSIGLVDDGVPVAGGIYNPAADEMIVGALGVGVFRNGQPVSVSSSASLTGTLVLASRSEHDWGDWDRFENSGFRIRAVGSIAYKMGLVAAGQADATWTLSPRHEWDIAGGAALVAAAGGIVRTLDWRGPRFNRPALSVPGLVACAPGVAEDIRILLACD
jgi:myo-inositol-1(or 4)-monophosphatase